MIRKMKNATYSCLLTLFATLTFSTANSQDSCHITTEKDKFTDQVTISGTATIIGLDKMLLIFKDRVGSEMKVAFGLNQSGKAFCFNNESTIILLFADGSKVTHRWSTEPSCEGIAILYSSSSGDIIKQLEQKRLSAIRFIGSNHQTDFDIPEDKGNELMKDISCIKKG